MNHLLESCVFLERKTRKNCVFCDSGRYCLPICVTWQVILKVAVLPSALVTVISVFPVPPRQMATGKVALYVLLGLPFSVTSTCIEWKVKISREKRI